ncbi:hypothetical protein [Micromonospora sp. RHAY321]|nr:hypothetical protein [Micromonospora sp. RHAY321]
MTEQERNVEVVRRYLRTFVTRDLAELRAVVTVCWPDGPIRF